MMRVFGGINMEEHTDSLIVDSGTVASHPGQIKIEAMRWLRYRPLWPFIWAALFIFTGFLAVNPIGAMPF